jgi:hypothetical protein
MKKLFVLMIGLMLSAGLMAQGLNSNLKFNSVKSYEETYDFPMPFELKSPAQLAPGDTYHEWINFAYMVCDATVGTNQWRTSSNIMFPDTFIMVRYWNTNQGVFEFDNVNWCSAGLVVDPSAPFLTDNFGFKVKSGQSYIVDSVQFFYWYKRFTDPSVVDTLVIQMYKSDHLSGYSYTTGPDAGKKAFAVPRYDRGRKEGRNADWEKRVPLTAADTFTSGRMQWGVWEEALPSFINTNGGPVGLTMTFKSGKAYNYLDTIPLAKWDSVQGVTNPLNAFWFASFTDQTQEELFEFSNGVNINTQQRYTDFSPNFASVYLSFSMWTYPVYPVVLYKITYTETVGMNNQAKDVKVQLYPTPANQGDVMTLELQLENSKNITADVYDIVGKKVASITNSNYNAGNYNLQINTSDLKPGMYICRINADGADKTIKFEVR